MPNYVGKGNFVDMFEWPLKRYSLSVGFHSSFLTDFHFNRKSLSDDLAQKQY